MKFTQTNVTKLRAPQGKSDATIWDEAMPGFGIRFRNGGAGTYIIQYTVKGREAKLTIGKVGKILLADAQNEARKHFITIAGGSDPHEVRAVEALRIGEPFGEKIEEYYAHLEARGRSASYISDHRRNLGTYMTDLHKKGLGEITRALIAAELDAIEEENGFRQAGLARSQIHSFFNWSIAKGWVEINPAAGTEKRNSERRSRVLTPAEIVAIWNATGGEDHFDKIVRLLLLTAARKTQIGSLNRKTDFSVADRLLDFIPSHVRQQQGGDGKDGGKTKNRERFWLALSDPAFEILESVPARNSTDYVFGHGEGGYSGWSSSKVKLDERLGDKVAPWTFHDFRRTFESLGIDKCKIEPWVTDVCLHHVGEHKKGVKRNYNHADYIDEKRGAMIKWADYVLGLVVRTNETQLAA